VKLFVPLVIYGSETCSGNKIGLRGLRKLRGKDLDLVLEVLETYFDELMAVKSLSQSLDDSAGNAAMAYHDDRIQQLGLAS